MTTKIAAISTGIYQINTWIVYVTEKKVLVIDPATSELTGDSLKIVDFLRKNNLLKSLYFYVERSYNYGTWY